MRFDTRIKCIILSLVLIQQSGIGQSPILLFDGQNDFVDLGDNAGNGIRTIEFWFRPGVNIDPTLKDFMALVARETSTQTNSHEFNISFQPDFQPHPGSLRFNITEYKGAEYDVYSDRNSWEAGKWYHIAAVVDPIDGMKLFIDGSKQISTNNYSKAPQPTPYITTLGCWGSLQTRFFKGSMEDIRFSVESLYDADFEPPCPDLNVQRTTSGLWNLNEGMGNEVIDRSSNKYTGIIYGATWEHALICTNDCSAFGVAMDIDPPGDSEVKTITALPENGSGPYSYIWSTEEETASIEISKPGEYSVTVTDNRGCIAFDSFSFRVHQCPLLYPNPTFDQMHLKFKSKDVLEFSLSVFDALGRCILYSENTNSKLIPFDETPTLVPGSYFAKLLLDDTVCIIKFVVQ